jgi:hypothetical protein
MRIELNKYSKKHEDVTKQRDTDTRISRHQYGGCIVIKIDPENGLVFCKLNHILHSCPDYINVTNTIKEYINANIKLSVLKIYHEIKK